MDPALGAIHAGAKITQLGTVNVGPIGAIVIGAKPGAVGISSVWNFTMR
jgi:hypothetical protein